MHQSVLIVDSARPVSGEVAAERFRLTDAFMRGPENVLDELVDSFEELAVVVLEPESSHADGVKQSLMRRAVPSPRFWRLRPLLSIFADAPR